MTIQVLIADDDPVVRAGLTVIINRDPEFTVVGEAADGQQAIAMALALRPRVVLMDVRMPRIDGIQATKELLAQDRDGDIRVIVLTTFDSDEYVFDALRAGASGFLLKDADPDELRHAVRVVAAGDSLLTPGITRRLIKAYASQPVERPFVAIKLAGLTDREAQIVALVGRGLNNEEIAAHLVVSAATVKTHISRAMAKIGARDRAQVVIAAYESGLTRLGENRPNPG
jgi:DNA-binding NarL/FixJ family response regulator